MPVPQYLPFRQKIKPVSLREVTGGMSSGEVIFEVERGARFVVFDYVVSVIRATYLRRLPVYFLKPGQSAWQKGLPYALLSLFLGWWSVPWGLIRTPSTIYRTLRGGRDVTDSVVASIKVATGREACVRKVNVICAASVQSRHVVDLIRTEPVDKAGLPRRSSKELRRRQREEAVTVTYFW